MGNRILVVATSSVGPDAVTSTIGSRFGADAEVLVVAPASGLSRIDWLTNAEDGARADAAGRAGEIADRISAGTVEATVGDTDPLKAIGDALRTFDADEIVLVTLPEEDASWLESDAASTARELFDIPITHLVVGG